MDITESNPSQTDPDEMFRAGLAAAELKDYAQALKYYLQAAAQGHAPAQNQIGHVYLMGHGVERNLREAVKWFRSAANLGFAPAQDHLGLMYKNGYGVTRDFAEGMKWFRKAADQGFWFAQYNLGKLYHQGVGVKADLIEAAWWYRKAADQGGSLAQNMLGMCYLKGSGVDVDHAQAVAWFRKAADQSDTQAEHNLGSAYQHGWGLKQDYGEAYKWLLKAAVKGEVTSQNDVGWFHVMGWGVQVDYQTAMNWFRKAAQTNYPPAQYNIGFLYERGFGVEQNLEEALKWYRKAAEQGFSPAREHYLAITASKGGQPSSAQVTPSAPRPAESVAKKGLPASKSTTEKTSAWYRKIVHRDESRAPRGWRVLTANVQAEAQRPTINLPEPGLNGVASKQVASELNAWRQRNPKDHFSRTLDQVTDSFDGSVDIESTVSGGMGVIQLCRTTGEHGVSYHAEKSIRPELLGQRGAMATFEREARLWISLLPHPNVVRAMAFFNGTSVVAHGRPHLTLEYIDGGNLRHRLVHGALPEDELLRISLEFCDGMQFLFQFAGIVHRDIKPENILFTRAGVVKITDFGIAKALLSAPGVECSKTGREIHGRTSDLETRGTIAGTLPYMSPEQYVSPHGVSNSSDIYSFGMVLYEMATGCLPFRATTLVEWQNKHLYDTAAPPASFAPVSKPLSDVVMKCLEKRHTDRFRDFTELRAALERYCHSTGRSSLIPPLVDVSDLEAKLTAGEWFFRGHAFEQMADDENAVKCYRESLRLNSTYPPTHRKLGEVFLRMGRREEALHHYQAAVELNKHPHAHTDLGNAYIAAGKNEDGLTAIRKAAQLGPSDITVWRRYALAARSIDAMEDFNRALAMVVEMQGFVSNGRAASIENGAIFFAEIGRLDLALQQHILCVKKFPSYPWCFYNFAVTMHRSRLFDDALKLYGRAVALDKRFTLAYINSGFIHAVRGERERAEHAWRSAIAMHPGHDACELVESLCRIQSALEFEKALAEYVPGHPQTTIKYLQMTEAEENALYSSLAEMRRRNLQMPHCSDAAAGGSETVLR